MKIQLIAADMDGTLLNQYSEITEDTAKAICRLKDRGVEFLICSGRDYRDASQIAREAGIDCDFICLSGAHTYDRSGRQLSEYPLTPDNIADICRIFAKHGAALDILTAGGRYSTMEPERKIREFYRFMSGTGQVPEVISPELSAKAADRLKEVCFIGDISELPEGDPVLKILGNDLSPELVVRLKEEFSACPQIAAASSFPTNIELTNVMAQKGVALKAYASSRGIPLEAVMTLGDSDNDLSMFTEEFGWTVAMENAMDCIRQTAKYHTKSNLEDGVAYAIEKYVFSD